MWRYNSIRIVFSQLESFGKCCEQLNPTFQQIHRQRLTAGFGYEACLLKKGLRQVAGKREGSRMVLPEIANQHMEAQAANKIDETYLLDESSWQRIGDTEEIVEIDEFKGISLQHGITGVFDIEELVAILNQEKLDNIAVIAVPPHVNYVDYMVITTGKSPKQMTAVAEFIQRIFKRRTPSSIPPVLEGKNDKDWVALDLGNIALHIFSSKARKMYDLETLWTCGAAYDDQSNHEDVFSALLRQHTFQKS